MYGRNKSNGHIAAIDQRAVENIRRDGCLYVTSLLSPYTIIASHHQRSSIITITTVLHCWSTIYPLDYPFNLTISSIIDWFIRSRCVIIILMSSFGNDQQWCRQYVNTSALRWRRIHSITMLMLLHQRWLIDHTVSSLILTRIILSVCLCSLSVPPSVFVLISIPTVSIVQLYKWSMTNNWC